MSLCLAIFSGPLYLVVFLLAARSLWNVGDARGAEAIGYFFMGMFLLALWGAWTVALARVFDIASRAAREGTR